MSNYRIYGSTKENGVLANNLVIAYKADRGDWITAGEELGRSQADSNGLFEIAITDWDKDIFVVALDTDPTAKYQAIIRDWVKADYIGSDQYFDDVVLLMHMEGSNGGNSFIDLLGHNVVPIGEAQTSTVQAKFGTASLLTDGTDDRLEVDYDPAFNLVDNDFTIEFWCFPTTSTGYQVFTTRRRVDDYAGIGPWLIRRQDTTLHMYFGKGNYSWMSDTTAGTILQDEWTHVAITRSGAVFSAWINGIYSGGFTDASLVMSNDSKMLIGAESDGSSPYTGYMDEVRVTVGTARYTQNFIPPTQQFHGLNGDPYFNYVKSLLHMDGGAGQQLFTDEIGNTVTAVGNTYTDQVDNKYGTASARFDGSGDYLQIEHNTDFVLGPRDFTIEAWVRFDNAYPGNVYQMIWAKRNSSAIYGSFVSYCYQGRFQAYVRMGVSTWSAIDAGAMQSNTWHHVAHVRKANKVYAFIDGVLVGTNNALYPVPDDTYDIYLGGHELGTPHSLTGMIDDFRYTPGFARYTEDFTPPAFALPNS